MTYSFSLPHHYKLNYQRNSNILVEDYRTIYFNTQKNANSSMKAQFIQILGIDKTEKFPNDIHYNYNFPAVLQDELGSKYHDFLKFSILRNPWERLVSCYNNKIRQSSVTGKNYILDCNPNLYIGMPFKEFVEVIAGIPDSESDFHFCAQIYLMLYPDGTFPMNYLCNIEKLDFYLGDIKSKTGIPFTSLTRLNKSEELVYQSLYTPDLIEKVAKRYQADIHFFKYEFGKKNKQFSFGSISEDWLIYISEHPLMLSLLKDKNRELVKTLSLKTAPQTKEIKDLKKEIATLKKELDNFENSLSWKMTHPLRALVSKIWKK